MSSAFRQPQPRVPLRCPPNFQARFVVRPGDTMFFIADEFNVGLAALITANPHIPDPNVLIPGDVLCVPAARIPVQCPPGFRGRYVVQPTDTMFAIAQRFNITVAALIAANPHIPDPAVLFPRDVLCIPAPPAAVLPCVIILEPVDGLPPEARGVAFIRVVLTGQHAISFLALELPPPQTLGNFDIYAAELRFPPPDPAGFGTFLQRLPGDPLTWAGTARFTPPPDIPFVPFQSTVLVRAFNAERFIPGPPVLIGSLAQC